MLQARSLRERLCVHDPVGDDCSSSCNALLKSNDGMLAALAPVDSDLACWCIKQPDGNRQLWVWLRQLVLGELLPSQAQIRSYIRREQGQRCEGDPDGTGGAQLHLYHVKQEV